jgi:hypothetical protein
LNQNIFLSHLVASYYSESTEQLVLRCGNCCTHTTKCPQTGNCKPKNATTQQILSKLPEYLLVQLIRFGIFGNIKNQTCVIPNKVLELPNLDKYELVTVTNHIGPTASSGHYVTCTNLLGLTWVLCDDNSFSAISEYGIISPDNYVYLYKKVASKENKSTGNLLAPNSKMETTDYAMKNNKLDNSIYRETCQKDQSVPTNENSKRLPQNKNPHVEDFKSEPKECKKFKKRYFDLEKHNKTNDCSKTENYESSQASCQNPRDKKSPKNSKEMTRENLDSGVECRGCKAIYKRLLVHLNSKNGMSCKALYGEDKLVRPSKSNKYYEKNKAQILEKRKKYYMNNAQEMKQKKNQKDRINYAQNRSKIKAKRKADYEENLNEIKKKRKIHYEKNKQKIKEEKRTK